MAGVPASSGDLAAAANALADSFYAAATALDRFRVNSVPPLAVSDSKRLKDEAGALEMRAQHFTALAIGATLAAVQADLGRIQETTKQALAQLQHLKEVQRGIALATSLLSLGTAIAAGSPATIGTAVQSLTGVLGEAG